MASGLLQELLPVPTIMLVHRGVSGLREETTAILHVLNGERAPDMSLQEVCVAKFAASARTTIQRQEAGHRQRGQCHYYCATQVGPARVVAPTLGFLNCRIPTLKQDSEGNETQNSLSSGFQPRLCCPPPMMV